MKSQKNKNEVRLDNVFTNDFLGELLYFATSRIITLLVAISLLGLIFFNFIFSLSMGPSMEPSIPNNSIVIARKTKKVDIDDIVIFHAPDVDALYTKRIIAKGNDIIDIKRDVLYINNQIHNQVHSIGQIDCQTQEFCEEYIVSTNSYYVIGDNPRQSMDSRSFGSIKEDLVLGKVFIVIPVDKYLNKLPFNNK